MKKQLTRSLLSLALILSLLTVSSCRQASQGSGGVDKDLSTSASATVDESQSASFEAFLADLFLNEISLDTITLHYSVQDPSAYQLENQEAKWYSSDEADRYPNDRILEILATYDPNVLTEDQQLTYRILKSFCEKSLEISDEKYAYFIGNFDLAGGIQSNLPTVLSEYEFYSEKDVQDYISLLYLTDDYLSVLLEEEDLRVEAGYGWSDSVLDEILEQCRQISDAGDDFYLYSVTTDKLSALDFLSDSQKSEYIAQATEAIQNGLIPAFSKTVERLESYKGKATNSLGLCYFENGADYYQLLAQINTGTELTCQEMIDALDADFADLYSQLYQVYLYNSAAYMAYVEGSYDVSLTDPEDILSYLRQKINDDFPAISGDSYEISYLPSELEEVMSDVLAYYVTPQVDNYLHGKIRINGASLSESGFYSTLAHEGFPGHMYQSVYFYSQNPSDIRKLLSCSGYSEGWAVYAENYAYKLYAFEKYDTALTRLYQIDDQLSWNVSCRIDLGVNYEGWTLTDLQNYLEENGFDSSSAQEIMDFVIGSPTTYLQYYIGYLEFKQMYEEASTTLSKNFDAKEFHEAVLSVGSVPFKFVWESVEKYIADHS
jgi:uncharacterized protein (DUF885 family)